MSSHRSLSPPPTRKKIRSRLCDKFVRMHCSSTYTQPRLRRSTSRTGQCTTYVVPHRYHRSRTVQLVNGHVLAPCPCCTHHESYSSVSNISHFSSVCVPTLGQCDASASMCDVKSLFLPYYL